MLVSNETNKLPLIAHVVCGWPLLMIFIGGAIGGGLGGVAYALNIAIYKSSLPLIAKIPLIILTGVAAFGLWFAIIVIWFSAAVPSTS